MHYEELQNRTSKRIRIYKHIDRINQCVQNSEKPLFPITIDIYPTNMCNSRCNFCLFHETNANRAVLSRDVFYQMIDSIIGMNVRAVSLAGGGEPTMHPYLAEGITRLTSAGIKVGVITNGISITDKLFDAFQKCTWIRFSLLTHRAEEYEKLTGNNKIVFEHVADNIRRVTGARMQNSNLTVGVTKLISTDLRDENEVYDFIDYVKELGIDQAFFSEKKQLVGVPSRIEKTKYIDAIERIRDYAKWAEVAINIEKFTSQEKNIYLLQINNDKCEILITHLTALITADGNVYPCTNQYLAGGTSLGNINKTHLEHIYERDNIKEKAAIIQRGYCKGCKSANTVKEIFLYRNTGVIKECKDLHYDFL